MELAKSASALSAIEVADGTRTHDHRDHNPGLYQLSYRHRVGTKNSLGSLLLRESQRPEPTGASIPYRSPTFPLR
jgi:hypothetical protein